jgi:hypothetical protein
MNAYVIRILKRICARMSHMRYTVVNCMYIKIYILKSWFQDISNNKHILDTKWWTIQSLQTMEKYLVIVRGPLELKMFDLDVFISKLIINKFIKNHLSFKFHIIWILFDIFHQRLSKLYVFFYESCIKF